jgi:trehalose 6-phosphate phosphatase
VTTDRSVLEFAAVLFDLDGVLTSTATIHEAAWKAMFDEFLLARAEAHGEPFVAFTNDDYLRFVDGKPRFDGVRAFLSSRDIELPDGDADAEPSSESIAGLGNRKNRLLNELLDEHGVDPLPGAVEFVRAARAAGVQTAVVSSSANADRVLAAAGLTGMFDTVVDGNSAGRLALAGKPAPDTFLEAAHRLGVAPQDAVVVEDALAGVAAGRAGDFGLVVGIAPPGSSAALLDAGADLVVGSLAELLSD